MQIGDMIYPKKYGQIPLPFMELKPAMIIAIEHVEPNEEDCQSDWTEKDGKRWIILSDGVIYAYSNWIVESFYECG